MVSEMNRTQMTLNEQLVTDNKNHETAALNFPLQYWILSEALVSEIVQ